jgi:hypothetical protein
VFSDLEKYQQDIKKKFFINDERFNELVNSTKNKIDNTPVQTNTTTYQTNTPIVQTNTPTFNPINNTNKCIELKDSRDKKYKSYKEEKDIYDEKLSNYSIVQNEYFNKCVQPLMKPSTTNGGKSTRKRKTHKSKTIKKRAKRHRKKTTKRTRNVASTTPHHPTSSRKTI